jgi:hypothetical protein
LWEASLEGGRDFPVTTVLNQRHMADVVEEEPEARPEYPTAPAPTANEPAVPESESGPTAAPPGKLAGWGVSVGSFVGSRALFFAMVFGIAFTNARRVPHPRLWWHSLNAALFNSDGYWYWTIAHGGYHSGPFTVSRQRNWGFFPLYPYLTRWTSDVTRWRIISSGYILSSLAFLLFLPLLWRWVSFHAGIEQANLAVILAAFIPLTPFFVAYRASSVFLLLSTATLYAIDRHHWGWAVGWGALASLTRPPGILLVVPFVVAIWMAPGLSRLRRGLLTAAGALFATGFVVVGAIDRRDTGHAFAFLQIQRAWGRALSAPFVATLRWLAHPGIVSERGWSIPWLDLAMSVLGVAVAVALIREDRSWWPAAIYLIAIVIFANSSTSLQGIPRFIAHVPTLYAGVALVARKYRAQIATTIAFAGMMAVYTALWVLGLNAVRT